jgi:ABC-type lipoprotein release transport system permease subunit
MRRGRSPGRDAVSQGRTPVTSAAAALLLAAAALLGSWAPARRASHVDPMVARRD